MLAAKTQARISLTVVIGKADQQYPQTAYTETHAWTLLGSSVRLTITREA